MVKISKIIGFTNYYITDTGDVYSSKYNNTKKIKKLTPWVTNSGYLMVDLNKNNKKTHKLIHRLVAEAFIPNPENKPQVNHKNGNKRDNNIKNLEWATSSENNLHAYKFLGRTPPRPWLGKFGKNNSSSKIVQQIKNGNIISEFYGTAEASRKTKVQQSDISACCLGKRKTAGGYTWRYK